MRNIDDDLERIGEMDRAIDALKKSLMSRIKTLVDERNAMLQPYGKVYGYGERGSLRVIKVEKWISDRCLCFTIQPGQPSPEKGDLFKALAPWPEKYGGDMGFWNRPDAYGIEMTVPPDQILGRYFRVGSTGFTSRDETGAIYPTRIMVTQGVDEFVKADFDRLEEERRWQDYHDTMMNAKWD